MCTLAIDMEVASVFLIAHLLGFATSVHSVMNTRTAQGAVAWAVCLNTLPYVAVIAYWIFGRSKFQGYVRARRSADSRLKEVETTVSNGTEPFQVTERLRPQALRAAESLAGVPLLSGNAVELLVDGDATFDSIFQGIDEAQEYILVQFYIVHDDDLGRRLKERLIARAKEGIRVFFMFDEIGSMALSRSYQREMREAGVDIRAFHATKGRTNRFQLNFRNHRKIVVTDGRVAWIGGHNVGDEYLGKDEKFGHWRDTHVRIEGPGMLNAQLSFVEDWNWATDEIPELRWDPAPAVQENNAHVLVTPSGPADELETCNLMFVHALNTAESRIWIASPYFVPDHSVVVALQAAGLRGVDVRLLVPEEADSPLVHLASYAYFDDAMRTGAKIYRYTDGFLHQKTMLIDDQVATIGTANFDNRSFRLNFEVTAAISEPSFIEDVKAMFNNDFSKATPIEPGEYDRQRWWYRVMIRFARLTAPIL
ncbi:MAG: cardiolipin synthase [Myxococcota bacterium]